MPDLLDDFEFDDDSDDGNVPVLPPNPTPEQFNSWKVQIRAILNASTKVHQDAEKDMRAELATFEPYVAAWYAEVETLSAKRWRTLAEQRRLDELIDRIDNQPELVRRMGPPPWPKDVIDTELAN